MAEEEKNGTARLNNTQVIALEEHYWDAEMASRFPAGEDKSNVADLWSWVPRCCHLLPSLLQDCLRSPFDPTSGRAGNIGRFRD
jgi:hypothetical protein